MNGDRLRQLKETDFGLESRSIFPLHSIAPRHAAKGRRQWAARGVFKSSAGLDQRLLSNNAWALDLFGMTGSVHDVPMAIGELNRLTAFIGDSYRIQEKPMALIGV